jgi:hypothetical protein
MDRLGGFWWVVLPAWLWALLPLWASSSGYVGPILWALLFFVGLPAVFQWLAGGVICVRATEGRIRLALWWLSAPGACVAAVVLSATDVPLIVRFHLSEAALRAHAEHGPPETSRVKGAQTVGLFHVTEVWRHGRTVAFTTNDGKVFGDIGVIYAPDGLPKDLPMEVEELLFARYTHIAGAWYRFEMGD